MKINEIFSSIAGEINLFHQGVITTFVRLQGCNLRCSYCDTPETQSYDGIFESKSPTEIVSIVKKIGNKVVCLTGGEPLLQGSELGILLKELKYNGFKTVIETNGTMRIQPFLDVVDCFVIDYKIEYENKMIANSFYDLRNKDVVKFPVSHRDDITHALHMQERMVINNSNGSIPLFAISPLFQNTYPLVSILLIQEMIEKYCKFKERTVISVQLHKLLGVK